MNKTDIEFLDDVAKCAMTAMIAKSPFTTNQDIPVETLKQLQNSVAKGAYSYALNMLKVRNEIITADNINKEKVYADYLKTVLGTLVANKKLVTAIPKEPVTTISPGGFLSDDDKPVPEAAAYYGFGVKQESLKETVKETVKESPVCFLRGRPIFKNTVLTYIDTVLEDFEKDGKSISVMDKRPYMSYSYYDYFKDNTVGWKSYVMEKPELWLHGKPVYKDSVLLTCSFSNGQFTQEIVATKFDSDSGNTPLVLLFENYDDWKEFYKVK